jgi:hypothetical protein
MGAVVVVGRSDALVSYPAFSLLPSRRLGRYERSTEKKKKKEILTWRICHDGIEKGPTAPWILGDVKGAKVDYPLGDPILGCGPNDTRRLS